MSRGQITEENFGVSDSGAAAPLLARRKKVRAASARAKETKVATPPPALTETQLARYSSRVDKLAEKLALTEDQKSAFLTDPIRNELALLSRLPILSSLPFATTLDDSCREEIPGGIPAAINLLEWEPQHPAAQRLLDSIWHAEAADAQFSRSSVSLNAFCRRLRIPPLEIYNEITRIALKVGANKASIRSATAQEQITARSVVEALQPGPDGFEDRKIHLQYAGIAPIPKTAITNISGQNIGGIALIGSQNGLPAFEKDVLDLDRQPLPTTIEGRLVGEPEFDPETMDDSGQGGEDEEEEEGEDQQ